MRLDGLDGVVPFRLGVLDGGWMKVELLRALRSRPRGLPNVDDDHVPLPFPPRVVLLLLTLPVGLGQPDLKVRKILIN